MIGDRASCSHFADTRLRLCCNNFSTQLLLVRNIIYILHSLVLTCVQKGDLQDAMCDEPDGDATYCMCRRAHSMATQITRQCHRRKTRKGKGDGERGHARRNVTGGMKYAAGSQLRQHRPVKSTSGGSEPLFVAHDIISDSTLTMRLSVQTDGVAASTHDRGRL